MNNSAAKDGGIFMTIALIAHDAKKELMVQFCMAYRHILEQHRLLATGTTGRLVEENAGLKVTKFLPGGHGVRKWTCCSSSATPSAPSPMSPMR